MSGHKSSSQRKWYCHECNDGPLSCKFDDACPNCAHMRCAYCETVKMTYSSHH